MKNLKFTNLAVFIIFFGIALIEAVQKGNWLAALLFVALGMLSLRADLLWPWKSKTRPHANVYTRLAPSKISGVGVFAIKDIPANTNLFSDDDVKMIELRKDEVDMIDSETKKLYDDFCVIRGEKYICPQNFNDITVGWFINHSSENPNVVCDENLVFHSASEIKAGEELTLDYSTYSEK